MPTLIGPVSSRFRLGGGGGGRRRGGAAGSAAFVGSGGFSHPDIVTAIVVIVAMVASRPATMMPFFEMFIVWSPLSFGGV